MQYLRDIYEKLTTYETSCQECGGYLPPNEFGASHCSLGCVIASTALDRLPIEIVIEDNLPEP